MARTDGKWQKRGTFLIPNDNVPVVLRNDYLNFGGITAGDIGFGIRNNDGNLEYKNNLGVWTPFITVGSGVSKNITYNANGTFNSSTDAFGSKTAVYSAGLVLSLVGTGIYKTKTVTYNSGNQPTNITV